MKTHLISLLFLLFILTSKAQVYKSYINKQGEICDSAMAHSFIINSLHSDSLWHVRNHSIKDGALLFRGTYADRNMQTPHGLFTYYAKGDSDRHYMNLKGAFLNGEQHGEWTEYFSNSMIKARVTYKKGKKHGETENYNIFTGKPKLKGYFVEGLRENEWITYDDYDNPIETTIYKKNEAISRTKHPLIYRRPGISPTFEKYIKSSLKDLITDNKKYGLFLVRAALEEDGHLSKTSIIYTFGGAANFGNQIHKILAESPAWLPAYNEKENKAVKDSVEFLIRYSKFGVSTEFQRSAIDRSASVRNRSIEIAPIPQGGITHFLENLAITYTEEARKNNVSGRVLISFVVEADGSLTEFKLLRGIGYGLDEEAIRSLKHSSKWFPGIQNGKPVRVTYTLPIAFQVKG